MRRVMSGYASIDKPQNIGKSFFEVNPLIPNMNVYTAISALSLFYRKEIAIECHNLSATYQQMLDDAVTISLALKELGVKKGDIIAASMPNFYQGVSVFLACNRIGAVTTFLNSFAPAEEINDYLNLFESPIFINYGKSNEENFSIKKNTGVKYIVTLQKNHASSLDLTSCSTITTDDVTIDYNSLGILSSYQRSKFERYHGIKENSLILFTSGTTGKPKSVVLTNENILASAIYLKNSSNLKNNSDKRTLVCVPFTYPYGFGTSTLMTLLSGKTAILAPNIGKNTISSYLKQNPNIIFGSPALLELIMRYVPANQNLSSVTTFISGGDFLTPAANKRGVTFFKQHGASVEIGNGSGNAETMSCGTNPVGIKIRPETAGKILVGTEAIIIDPETMEEKKYGEEGLLCVSGKHVFKEYYKEPELTAESKIEKNNREYFKTGTLGYIDSEGYFTITGRQSRFYIMSTLNKVYCDHIQNIISNLECVNMCAIVKVPDEEMLYVNKAYIVLNDGYERTDIENYIYALCQKPIINSVGEAKQLKSYEIPSYIEIVESLPRKAGTDKIDYEQLEKDAVLKQQEQSGYQKKMQLSTEL